ncbi:MAG: amidohydrolase family protein [Gammaproteobacteria bacterium]
MNQCSGLLLRLAVCAATLLAGAAATAETPRIFAITNVRIVTAPGQTFDDATVVLRDGLIEAVGADVEPPADARIFEGESGWTVYPSFIDAASTIGLDADTANDSSRPPRRAAGGNTRPGAPHELEAVHPEYAVVNRIDFAQASVERHRELGFAVAHVLPDKGVFRGESAVVLTRDAPAQKLVLSAASSQVVALETSSFMARKYPSSSIGAVATVRQTLLDAERHRIWTERYATDPRGMPRPEFRASDAALLAVLRGERPVVFVSRAALDPGRFREFASEFELRALTVATGLAHRPDDLRAAEMPVLLPMVMPDKPDLGDADEIRDTTLQELQSYVGAPRLPGLLAAADIDFAFVTLGMKSVRKFHEHLAAVVDAGLSADVALAAVTTVPARLLGLDRVIGTIEVGKQANLFIVDGDLLTDKPELRHVFVDGYHEEIEPQETIGDPNAVVDPRGTWEIVTEVMGRAAESTWTISGTEGNYRGFSEGQGGKQPFRSVELRGNAMTVTSDTSRGEFEITVIVSGEALEGDTEMESPRGSAKMEVEGRRVEGPEEMR